ncbi:hypothetical protein SRHO_G00060150 [Serrasalmus rhombeus]
MVDDPVGVAFDGGKRERRHHISMDSAVSNTSSPFFLRQIPLPPSPPPSLSYVASIFASVVLGTAVEGSISPSVMALSGGKHFPCQKFTQPGCSAGDCRERSGRSRSRGRSPIRLSNMRAGRLDLSEGSGAL